MAHGQPSLCVGEESEMRDMITAKVDGRTYQIPGMWLAGFLRGRRGATVQDAVLWWHEQELMAEECLNGSGNFRASL